MGVILVKQTSNKQIIIKEGNVYEESAKPKEKYKLIDSETGKTPEDLIVQRDGDNLILKSKSLDSEVRLVDFWGNCKPGDTQCYAIIDSATTDGIAGESIITQAGPELIGEQLLAGQIGTLSQGAIAAAALPTSLLAGIGLTGIGIGLLSNTRSGRSGSKSKSKVDELDTDVSGNNSPEASVNAPVATSTTEQSTDVNEGSQTNPTPTIVDTTPPAKPSAPTSYKDNVGSVLNDTSTAATTDDTTPGINIGKNLTDIPKLYDKNGNEIPAVYDSATGTLTPKNPLDEGEHQLTYTLSDAAGNESVKSDPIAITVDTTAPDNPPAPANYKDNQGKIQTDISTAPTTDDKTPGINIGTVSTGETPTLYVNGNKVPADSTRNSDGSITLTPKTAIQPDGSYNFSYTLTDAAGNESNKSDPIVITVDTTPPAKPSAPTNYKDDVGSVLNDTSTATTTDDTKPGINIGVVPTGTTPILYIDGDIIEATATKNSDGTTTLTPTYPLGRVSHNVSYTLTDAAGNESLPSDPMPITVDTTAPGKPNRPSSYKDDAGTVNSDTSTATTTDDTTPGINIGTALTDKPALYVDGVKVESVYNATTGTLTPTNPLGEGNHQLTYTLSDTAGNESPQSNPIAITIDNTAPTGKVTTVSIVKDADNNGYINKSELGSATTTDVKVDFDAKVVAGDVVTLDTNGDGTADKSIAVTSTANKFVTFTAVALPADGSTLTVKAGLTDAAGNASTTSVTDAAEVDTSLPSKLTISFPQDTSTTKGTITSSATGDSEVAYNATTIKVRATFDKTKVQTGDTVTLTDSAGNTKQITLKAADVAAGFVEADFPKPAENGDLEISTAKIKDSAGNESTNATGSVTVDLLLPGTPTVVIDGDANNDGYISKAEYNNLTTTGKTDITVSFPTSNGAGTPAYSATTAGYEVSIDVGGTQQSYQLTKYDANSGSYTFKDITVPASGSDLTVTASLKDTQGNIDVGTKNNAPGNDKATIDTGLPSVAITSDKASLKTGETATVTFTLSEASNDFTASDVSVTKGTLTDFKKTSANTYTASFTPAENTNAGSATVSVAANKFSDVAGNENSAPANTTISYDTKAPTATVSVDKTALKVGDTANVTIKFSEAVKDFASADDVTAEGGKLSSMTSTDNITWTGKFMPTTNTEDTSNVIKLANSYTDNAGNAGNTAQSGNYSIDTKAPTVAVNALRTSDTTPEITGTVDDPNATIVVTINGADYTAINNKNGTWTIADNTVTALTGNTLISVKATDKAGNETTSTATIDYFTPVASIAVSPASVVEDANASLTYTVTFDKAPTVDTMVNLSYTGTANGTDYSRVPTVVIEAGKTTGSVSINPISDNVIEADETIEVTLAGGTGYTVTSTATAKVATGTITNDDRLIVDVLDANDSFSSDNTAGTNQDNYTNIPTVNVTNLPTGSAWEYSLDGGTSWKDGTGSTITLPNNTAVSGVEHMVQARIKGKPASASDTLNVTLDKTSNVAPALHEDTAGASNSDLISNNGQVDVTTETDAVWQYSTNGGSTWNNGSGTSFTLVEGTYAANAVQVRQIDKAGNTSTEQMGVIKIDKTVPVFKTDSTEDNFDSLDAGHVFSTDDTPNAFGYFEARAAGTVLGKIVATDEQANDTGIHSYKWASSNDATQASWYSIDSSTGTVTLTAAGAASAMNDYENTSLNEVTLTAEVTDVAGNKSTQNITFKLGNVIGIKRVKDIMNTSTEALNQDGENVAVGNAGAILTTNNADKIYIGQKENGDAFSGAGTGNFYDIGLYNGSDEPPTLLTGGGSDFVSFKKIYTRSAVLTGTGNDVLLFNDTSGTSSNSPSTPFMHLEQGDDVLSTKQDLNGVAVLMGSGSDTVKVTGSIKDDAMLDLGSGAATSANSSALAFLTNRYASLGNDTAGDTSSDVNKVTVGGYIEDASLVRGTAGQDTIEAKGINNSAKVILGAGDDTVKIGQEDVSKSEVRFGNGGGTAELDLGAGNDTFIYGGTTLDGIVKGGAGTDTIILNTTANVFRDTEETNLTSANLTGIEKIKMEGTNGNVVDIRYSDLLADTTINKLFIDGNDNDRVDLGRGDWNSDSNIAGARGDLGLNDNSTGTDGSWSVNNTVTQVSGYKAYTHILDTNSDNIVYIQTGIVVI